jgi:hypothetical protein
VGLLDAVVVKHGVMRGVLVMGRSVVVTRRRAAATIRVLSPDLVPMSKEDEQQAIHAISAMISQWWREHGREDDAPETATKDDHGDDRRRTAATGTSGS